MAHEHPPRFEEPAIPQVIYTVPDGSVHVVDVPVGQSVMDGSVRNNLPGIVAECGGSCSCATCHVHVDDEFADLLGEPGDEETDLLEFLDGADRRSRLSCQLVVTEQCEGLRVCVPEGNG
ncbi:2Fe-2S iron-sulfur cluster-binding protein [Pseudonocardia endophytica]|uniref:2Fe-2S ferredoxin n=1 Tax=Pseudonocardia endophytica TaxID=401976 RepID=A0A4R1I1L7_PSEEN|nr:2Fe-2S iron-sulfur cluster-binding protein [Pseudonocardia endophytica]TCK26339.1 2Fe-2S ferredoxin [Pseudonocardia endophytica]